MRHHLEGGPLSGYTTLDITERIHFNGRLVRAQQRLIMPIMQPAWVDWNPADHEGHMSATKKLTNVRIFGPLVLRKTVGIIGMSRIQGVGFQAMTRMPKWIAEKERQAIWRITERRGNRVYCKTAGMKTGMFFGGGRRKNERSEESIKRSGKLERPKKSLKI